MFKKTRREELKARLLGLKKRQPTEDTLKVSGVLLSDAIKHYVDEFDLITPFRDENLKPASYRLTIGDECSVGGKPVDLKDVPGSNELSIPPFEVAIIRTNEIINMPNFLIGRWNIQVKRAYLGLLWVGGPQVDPGYVGHLFCPIYNLSAETVTLHLYDSIATIDFVKTTDFHKGESKEYLSGDELPDKVLLEDYEPSKLKSGLVTHALDKITAFEKTLQTIQTRVDTFTSVTVTIVGLLFAAVTIIAAKQGPSWWDPTAFWISAASLILAAGAWIRSKSPGFWFATKRTDRVIDILLIILVLIVISFASIKTQRDIHKLREDFQKLKADEPPFVPTN